MLSKKYIQPAEVFVIKSALVAKGGTRTTFCTLLYLPPLAGSHVRCKEKHPLNSRQCALNIQQNHLLHFHIIQCLQNV